MSGQVPFEPRTLALTSVNGRVFASLTDATGPAACAAGDPAQTLAQAEQLLVSLGSQPFAPSETIPQPLSCPSAPDGGDVPAGCVYTRSWGLTSTPDSVAIVSDASLLVSAATCSNGCYIEVQVTLAGFKYLLIVEPGPGDYPRCFDAGEFAFGPI